MTDVLNDNNWLLTVGTFLPLVGVLVMFFVPGSEEKLHKQLLILTAGATAAFHVATLQFEPGSARFLRSGRAAKPILPNRLH